MKIRQPMVSAVIALTKTAPAARSFIFLIVVCRSGEIKSATFSMDVLMSSRTNTKPIAKTIAIHSNVEISSRKPKTMTAIAAIRCNSALGSSLISVLSPLKAYPKLLICLEIENG